MGLGKKGYVGRMTSPTKKLEPQWGYLGVDRKGQKKKRGKNKGYQWGRDMSKKFE